MWSTPPSLSSDQDSIPFCTAGQGSPIISDSHRGRAACTPPCPKPDQPEANGDGGLATLEEDTASRIYVPAAHDGSVDVSPVGRDLAIGTRQRLSIVDLELPLESPRHLDAPTTWNLCRAQVDWNPHVSRAELVATTANHKAVIWNLLQSSTRAIQSLLSTHTRAVTDLQWSAFQPDEIATCALDTFIYIWDTRLHDHPVQCFSPWTAGGTAVRWNRKNEHIVASVNNTDVYIWDRRKGSIPISRLVGNSGRILSMDWSHATSSKLVSSSAHGLIQVWDTVLAESVVNRKLNLPMSKVAFMRSGSVLAWPEDLEEDPQCVFPSPGSLVQDFVLRQTPDAEDSQLVTWSSDGYLRLWPFDQTGYRPSPASRTSDIDSTPNDFRPSEGPLIVSFRNEPANASKLLRLRSKKNHTVQSSSSTLANTSSSALPPRKSRNEYLSPSRNFLSLTDGSDKGRLLSSMRRSVEFAARVDQDLSTTRPDAASTNIASLQRPQSLSEEFKVVAKRFPSISLETTDIENRNCVLSARFWIPNTTQISQIKLLVSFPDGYPVKESPQFEVVKTPMLSLSVRQKLIETLNSISRSMLKMGRPSLEACIRHILGIDRTSAVQHVTLRPLAFDGDAQKPETPMDDSKEMPDSDRDRRTLDIQNNDDWVPCPPFCGVSFNNDGKLLYFFSSLKNSKSVASSVLFPSTPRSLEEFYRYQRTLQASPAWDLSRDDSFLDENKESLTVPSLYYKPGPPSNLIEKENRQYFGMHKKKLSFNPTNLRSRGGYGKRLKTDAASPLFSAASPHSSSSLNLEPGARNERDWLEKGEFSFGSTPEGLFPTITLDNSVHKPGMDGANGNDLLTARAVFICSVEMFLPLNRELARLYTLQGSTHDICSHNRKCAESVGRMDLSLLWTLALQILGSSRCAARSIGHVYDATSDKSLFSAGLKECIAENRRMMKRVSFGGFHRLKRRPVFQSIQRNNQTLASFGPLQWGNHPFGRALVSSLFDHLEQIGDIQSLALLSCVFQDAPVSTMLTKDHWNPPGVSLACSPRTARFRGIPDDHAQTLEQRFVGAMKHTAKLTSAMLSSGIFGALSMPLSVAELIEEPPVAQVSKLVSEGRPLRDSLNVVAGGESLSRATSPLLAHSGSVSSSQMPRCSDNDENAPLDRDFGASGNDQGQRSKEGRSSLRCNLTLADELGITSQGTHKNDNLLDPLRKPICNHYKRMYAEILFSWSLLGKRAEVLKFVDDDKSENHDHAGPEYYPMCATCSSYLMSPVCAKCSKLATSCAVCHVAPRGLSTFCAVCGHGGHQQHIREWFMEDLDRMCPTGCGCYCVEMSGISLKFGR